MNSVSQSTSDLTLNCFICESRESDEKRIGEHGGRLVKTSCRHVVHLECITERLVSDEQAAKNLELKRRECTCGQPALPLLPVEGKSTHDEQSPDWTLLHEIVYNCEKRQTDIVKEILIIAPSLAKVKDKSGDTALHFAAILKEIEIVEALLAIDPSDASYIVGAQNNKGETALDFAKVGGNEKIIALLENFAASHVDHEKDNSTLTTNVKLDDSEKADKTAQAGSVVTNDPVPTDTTVDSRKKPLNDSPDTNPAPRELTKTESSTNSRNKALDDYVAEKDERECLVYLTNKKVTIHDADESGKTALHHAAEKGHSLCLACLLKYEAKIDTKDKSGKTALHHAAEKGHYECLNKLLEVGAKYDDSDNRGKTALHHAAEKGHYECLNKLLEVGANYNACDNSGKIALYYAISEKIELQQYAISAGDKARLEAYKQCLDKLCGMEKIKPKNVSNVLRFAIEENHEIQSIEKLFDQADLTVKFEDDKTLLHVTAENNNDRYLKKFLENLKEKGSEESIAIKDDKDRTPLHYAALKASSNFIDMLMYEEYEKNGKKKFNLREIIRSKCIDEKDKNGNTPLLLAAQNNGLACIEKLIKAKADVKSENNSNMGLLHFIAGSVEKEDKCKLLESLLRSDNAIKIKNVTEHGNKDSYTPLQHAAYHGNFDFVNTIRKFEKKPERFEIFGVLKKSNQPEKEVDSKLTIGVRDARKAPSLLELAIQGDQSNCLMKLLELKEKNDEKEEFKKTLSLSFLYAAVHGKYRCLKNISEAYKGKLDVNYQVGGKSALHYIVADECWLNNNKTQNVSQVIKSYRLCFNFLLKHGELKINLSSEEDMTPLHLAAKAKNIQCLATLLDQNKIGIFNTDKQGRKAEDVTEDPECKKALEEAKQRDKAKNPPPDYYRNKYFKIPNDQDSSEDYFADPIGPYIHYQEKLFESNDYYPEHDFTSTLKGDLKSMPLTEILERCRMTSKQVYDYYKKSTEETIKYFSAVGEELLKRGQPRAFHGYFKFDGELKFHKPPHYFKINSKYMPNLILDGNAYGFQETKERIIDVLHTYEKLGFHFTAKKINPSDDDEPKVYVNISLCHEDIGLGDLARKCTQRLLFGQVDLLLEPIKDLLLEPIKDLLTDKLQEIVSGVLSGSLNIINELKEIDIEECAKILTEKWSEDKKNDIDKKMEDEAKEYIKRFLQTLEGKCGDIKSEKFTVCSGSRSLLSNIKKNEKIRIELDRNESCNSPRRSQAHYQFKSNVSQVTFKELAEVLEELLK